jgi:hypothetical protein
MPVLCTIGAASVRSFGRSSVSAPPGQTAYTTPGTYSWVAPAGVTSVSVVAVGGGGASENPPTTGGGGGGLRYRNNISVTPGASYTVVVGNYAQPVGDSATVCRRNLVLQRHCVGGVRRKQSSRRYRYCDWWISRRWQRWQRRFVR